jgi:hypothetical protein
LADQTGEDASLYLTVILPEEPGKYTLRLTLLQEGAAWFDAHGAAPAEVPIEIRPAPIAHRELVLAQEFAE